jgi:hypothetical protein
MKMGNRPKKEQQTSHRTLTNTSNSRTAEHDVKLSTFNSVDRIVLFFSKEVQEFSRPLHKVFYADGGIWEFAGFGTMLRISGRTTFSEWKSAEHRDNYNHADRPRSFAFRRRCVLPIGESPHLADIIQGFEIDTRFTLITDLFRDESSQDVN